MSDVSQPTQTDEAGLQRTADGTLANPNLPLKEGTTGSNEKTEAKPEGDKPSLLTPEGTKKEGEPAKEAAKPEAKAGVPEKYELKAPEGFTINEATAAEASTLFKELGVTQDGAQKLVEFYAKQALEAAKAPLKAYQDLRAGWVREAKALPGIGTELEPNGKVVQAIGKALDQIGDQGLAKDFREAMGLTGAGDHPAVIRVLYHFAQQLTEGTHVAGNGPAKPGQQAPGAGRKSAAQEMYPTLPSGA